MKRPSLIWTVAALASFVAGCAAALGLDEPSLDPCAQGGCPDVVGQVDGAPASDAPAPVSDAPAPTSDGPSVDGPAADGVADAPHDAKGDGGVPSGVRCGGGPYGAPTYCDPAGATPTCCQNGGEGGPTSYSCVASQSACPGYAITCATYDDCSGNDICCHFSTHTVCDSVSSCPNTDVVCDPSLTDSCPSGWKCTVYLSSAGVESPYMGCSQ